MKPHKNTPTCDDCGDRILWATTAAGRYQPLNPVPDENGNVLAYRDALGVVRARSASGVTEGSPRHPLERLYMPHPATCRPRQQPLASDVVSLTDHRHRRS
jgi:hypothetical protein